MLPTPTLAALQKQLRQAICRRCVDAPPGSSSLAPDVPRDCEVRCELFRQLPRLKRAADLLDPTLKSRRVELEHLIREIVAQQRREGETRPPIARYARRVAATIDALYGW